MPSQRNEEKLGLCDDRVGVSDQLVADGTFPKRTLPSNRFAPTHQHAVDFDHFTCSQFLDGPPFELMEQSLIFLKFRTPKKILVKDASKNSKHDALVKDRVRNYAIMQGPEKQRRGANTARQTKTTRSKFLLHKRSLFVRVPRSSRSHARDLIPTHPSPSPPPHSGGSLFLRSQIVIHSMAATAGGNKIRNAKLVLLGDVGAGKSSLVLRFVKGQFVEFQESTIGAAFFSQTLAVNDETVKFEIWDTAGQERYHSLAPMYYRGAAAAIVVYDITNAASFTRAKKWVQELQAQGNPNTIMALAGNKADLLDERQVPAEEVLAIF
uniref:Uncharacterized protein n=1 Tax=Setaria italica TaxID=4555 RepID=K3Z804_SETIT